MHILNNQKEYSRQNLDQLDPQRTVLSSQDRRSEVDPEPTILQVDLGVAADGSADIEREAHAGVEVSVELSQVVRADDGHNGLQRRMNGESGNVNISYELRYGLW